MPDEPSANLQSENNPIEQNDRETSVDYVLEMLSYDLQTVDTDKRKSVVNKLAWNKASVSWQTAHSAHL